jgi:hypothetical protein
MQTRESSSSHGSVRSCLFFGVLAAGCVLRFRAIRLFYLSDHQATKVFERPPGVPFQKIQFGTDRAAGVLFYFTPGGAKI